MNDEHFDSIVLLLNPNKNKKRNFFLGQVTKASKNWGPDRHGERGQDWC